MFIQARIALGIQRSLDNFEHRQKHGTIPPTSTVTTREALSWITIEGARILGKLDEIGTLKEGKQADLVMIRSSDLNMQPVNDPVSTVVMQTSLANIENVMVAGEWKKKDGKLVGVELAPQIEMLNTSAHKITRALGL